MSAIKSINEMKAPLDSEMHVPKIATQAIPEPAKPTTTYYTPEKIIAMDNFAGTGLVIATEHGVYVYDVRSGNFIRLKFEIVEEQNE